MQTCRSDELRWQSAVELGQFGVWDLDPHLDIVHYSPRWKQHMGFANAGEADSTSFWRCRVHPDDVKPMLKALRSHIDGFRPTYEAKFRLRSNGSGYRLMLSRGLAVERDARGYARRMVGTMVDLTDRPVSPAREPQLFGDFTPSVPAGGTLPFHMLLGRGEHRQNAGQPNRDGLLGMVGDLLDMSLRQTT